MQARLEAHLKLLRGPRALREGPRESATIAHRARMSNEAALFPRNFHQAFPVAVRGEGCWLFSADGGKFLDAAGQAAVINIGHGVPDIGRAMADQSSKLAFAHTSQFHSPPAEKLAARLLSMAPPNFRKGGRVYFTSGGSEATETAIKLVRQYHIEKGTACALPCPFASSELSRQHAWRHDCQWQCCSTRALSAIARRVGAHRSLLLLSLSV